PAAAQKPSSGNKAKADMGRLLFASREAELCFPKQTPPEGSGGVVKGQAGMFLLILSAPPRAATHGH
ncbi:MAG: hypothetical protein KGQ79_07495, partial [Proteobacteria bacterium]|nr:hypothetical protein [Pseudomonadota bacterium]